MGIVFQDFRLLPDRNIYENVAYAMRVIGARPSAIKRQVPTVLSLVGLLNKSKILICIETKTNIMYSSHKKGDGQEAITHYVVMKETQKYSMLDVHIDTGRKNQIRVHMSDIGHKIIGDDKYQSTKNPIKRLGLHAYKLEYIDPITKQLMSFKANIPGDFNRFFAGQRTLKEYNENK